MAYAPAPTRLGPYELLRKLASGGMADVYEARRVGPHGFRKLVALKRILPQLAADPSFVAMFVDEARLSARLSHPNLVEVFDFGEDQDELYIAMELVEGTTMARAVRAAAQRGEATPLEVALYVALSVARGLGHAHELCDDAGRPLHLVHRDVAPGNILVGRAGGVKLADFGIARAAEVERRTDRGQLKGKLGYMAPEQVTSGELDHRTDQFQLGIVLAEMLTGRPLFPGQGDVEVLTRIRDANLGHLPRDPAVPEDLRPVLLRMLARDPDARFDSLRGVIDALEQAARGRGLALRPSLLVGWLADLALIEPAPRSGEHRVAAPAPLAEDRSARPLAGAWRMHRATPPPAAAGVAAAVYRVLLEDGAVGPLSWPRLVELFVTGKAAPTTPVAVGDGPFVPARFVPELERLSAAVALCWDDTTFRDARVRWHVAPGSWPTTLFGLAARRATGMLEAREGRRRKKVFWVDGVPEYAVSTDRTELLGAILVGAGRVMPMEIEMALAVSPGWGGRLGDALVGMGVVGPVELCRALVEQTRRRFVELAGWKSGEAVFVEGRRSGEETIPDACPPAELVARGVAQAYAAREIAELLANAARMPIVPVARAPFAPMSLRMTPEELGALELADGVRTGDQIVTFAGRRRIADAATARRALFLGLASGLLATPGWPPDPIRDFAATLPDRS